MPMILDRGFRGSCRKLMSSPGLSINSNSSMNSISPFANPSPPTRRPHREAPPSYQHAVSSNPLPANIGESTGSASQTSAASPPSLTTQEDPYAFLSSFDTFFLIDDSGSMAGRSWAETQSALRVIAPICTAHDANGVDVFFLNTRNQRAGPGRVGAGGFAAVAGASAVQDLFDSVRPGGGTPTGTRIQAILGPYVTAFEQAVAAAGGDADATGIKPVNLIVVTDGVPTDDPESVLLGLARRLDRVNAPPYQLGVQFFQVGNEPGAREALTELDDNLGGEVQGGVRDMVDTTTWDGRTPHALTGEGILKTVLGAVVKRLDRKRASLSQNRNASATS